MLSRYNELPVLITGGCGFIGSHIAEKLVSCGAHVSIMDDLSTGTVANIKSIKNKIRFIQASVTDKASCLKATHGQHSIFHLAALISVAESVSNPSLCHEINVNGTCNILEAARLNNVKRVILSSSSAVYGDTETLCNEQTPCNPNHLMVFQNISLNCSANNIFTFMDLKQLFCVILTFMDRARIPTEHMPLSLPNLPNR